MNVRELNKAQLEELREKHYWDLVDNEENILYISDITDEMLFEKYDGISFVNDDFSSTAYTVWITVYRDTVEPVLYAEENMTDILVRIDIAEQYYKEFIEPKLTASDIEWKTPLHFWTDFHTCDDTLDFYQYAKEHEAIIKMNPQRRTLEEMLEVAIEWDEYDFYEWLSREYTLEEIEWELGTERMCHIKEYWEEHGII